MSNVPGFRWAVLLLGAAATWAAAAQSPRSARPIPAAGSRPAMFDPARSAGLFVGVRRFTHDRKLAEVPNAVDDAIDLAFVVALDLNVRLVEPGRVILALSGEPQKEGSKQRLDALVAAGATVQPAGQTDILSLLDAQTQAAGESGILVISLATHGFMDAEGNQYLAAANTLVQHPETAIPANKIFDLASRSEAPRRLIFLDACRERLTSDTRQVDPDPRSAAGASLLRAIAGARGQVVLFGATAGGYAYDDQTRRNGVFTAAVVDGLLCDAPTDDRGFVTVDTLATYVRKRVGDWRRDHGYEDVPPDYNLGGDAASMPLAFCARAVSPELNPVVARTLDHFFNVFNDSGVRLWGREVNGRIVRAEVADLNGDGKNEVVLGMEGGRDGGKILAFGAAGDLLWSADTTTDFNYQGGQSGRMTIRTFATADLFRRGTRQVVALAIDGQAWYQSRLCIFDSDGTLLSSYWHPGHLRNMVIGSPTSRDAPRIIVGAINNDLMPVLGVEKHVGSVFMLDPKEVRGEAPPYLGRSGRGSHLWYGVLLPGGREPEHLELLDRNQDGVTDISVWTTSRTVFYLDFAGQVIATARGDGAEGISRFGLLVEEP